jgi:hypothetical protein
MLQVEGPHGAPPPLATIQNSTAAPRVPTQQVLDGILQRLKQWEKEKDANAATSYLYDKRLEKQLN